MPARRQSLSGPMPMEHTDDANSRRPSTSTRPNADATHHNRVAVARTRIDQVTHHISPRLPSTLAKDMSTQSFKQAPHKLLVIPGPIEVADDVLFANAHPAMSHVSPDFIPVFGDCIRMLREVLFAPNAQPVLTAGSGTLGWDHVAANVLQPGEDALVLNSGYFGDSFADCLETYGAKVDQIKAPIGSKPSLDEVEAALTKKKYKVLTFTHVDTSTGVLSDAKGLGELVKRVSPETILVLDGVCSVGSEEIRMDEWGIDVVLTATQKGLGCPPGLMVLAASKKAIAAFEKRTVPPNSYFASWSRWLPVMKAYEAGTGAYFATPPTNLIYALHASLTTITKGSPSLEERFQQHVATSDRVKDFVSQLGLQQLAADGKKDGAHGMTAVRYPQGVKATDLLPKLVAKNIVVAAGLHKQVKDEYFRIGHMGVTVVDKQRGDIDYLLNSIKEVLAEAGYKP
ncbi:PLP-dependent transferase [Moesziomyces antarcticus]|uniref:alanine--glyoxylate transaminase n=2 Tax=Pseudozyma antarctica TaxID=84753 RepID=A0A081CCQ7_PSEA2|nr:PLP-dependent transferase [Moesziomyces antarcticus]GAK64453.1 PLP-dependent transferase [Moesziomyces antarcticus]